MARRQYTTREVSRLLDLSEQSIRGFVRAGVVSGGRADAKPRGRGTGLRLRFDFADLLVLRVARALSQAGLPPHKVQRILLSVRRQLPNNQPLSAVQISVEGGLVVVNDGQVRWEPESGQTQLRLGKAAPDAGRLAAVVRAKKRRQPTQAPQSPDEWFELGLELEEDDPDGAYEAYLAALAGDPEHVEAMINVGRLCSEAGDHRRAAAYFRQATRVQPEQPVAHFNLAVTLHDLGRLDAAQASYRGALACDPEFADAHFNLATLLEETGDKQGALRHFSAYHAIIAR